jgi:hypothetical protein
LALAVKHSTSKKLALLALLAFALLAISFFPAYYAYLSLSEGRIITTDSVERYILIPGILRDPSLLLMGDAKQYYYSAADGMKPMVAAVDIVMDGNQEAIRKKITQYFLLNGYIENDAHEIKNSTGKQEISITIKKSSDAQWEANIALLDFLH